MPREVDPFTLQSRPPRNRKQLHAIQFLAAAAIVLLAGLAFPPTRERVAGLVEPVPGDGDLQVTRRVVSEDENGFALLDLDQDTVYRPRDYEVFREVTELSLGEGSNWELAEEVLNRNAEVLRRFEDSSRRPDFQFPEFETPLRQTTVTIEWTRIAQVLAVRAFYRAEKEGVHAGLQEAMKLIRFAQRVEAAQGSLIQWSLGSAFKREGLGCVRGLLDKGRLRSEQIVALARQLESYQSSREGFVFATKLEYQSLLEQIDKLASRELDPRDLFMATEQEVAALGDDFDVQEAKQRVANVVRSFLDLATRHEPTWGLQFPLDGYRSLHLPSERNGEPDVMADALCDHVSRGWRLGLEMGAVEDATLVATRTLLALRAHKQDTGRLARSLSELVPDYLREIPVDPFDGRPLRYKPTVGIVYSIGADLVDRGGSEKENPASARQDKDEPTFRIEF